MRYPIFILDFVETAPAVVEVVATPAVVEEVAAAPAVVEEVAPAVVEEVVATPTATPEEPKVEGTHFWSEPQEFFFSFPFLPSFNSQLCFNLYALNAYWVFFSCPKLFVSTFVNPAMY